MDIITHPGSISLARLRVEDHITFNMPGSLVMFTMGDLPRKVRNQKRRVAHPAHGIIQLLRRGEGLMTTLVRQDPKTSGRQSLDEGVQSPENGADGGRRNVLGGHKVVEDIEHRGENGDISSNIA